MVFSHLVKMSELDVNVVVVFPDGSKKRERSFSFPPTTLVADCLQTIMKKYSKYAARASPSDSDEVLNLIFVPRRLWLQHSHQIGSYEFPTQVRTAPERYVTLFLPGFSVRGPGSPCLARAAAFLRALCFAYFILSPPTRF